MRILALFTLSLFIFFGCSPVDTQAELKAACKHLEKGEYPQAEAKVDVCLEVDNENVDAIILKALCVYQNPQRGEARKEVGQALQVASMMLAPQRYDVWAIKAWTLYIDENYTEAIEAVRQARRLYRAAQGIKDNGFVPCDKEDKRLVQSSLPYARLLLMMADICRHNRLAEGREYFRLLEQSNIFKPTVAVELAHAQLDNDCGYLRDAIARLKRTKQSFPKDMDCAYARIWIQEIGLRRMSRLNGPNQIAVRRAYEKVRDDALAAGRTDIAERAAKRIQFVLYGK